MRSAASARLFCPQWLPRELVRASCQVNRLSLTYISCMADLCLYERCGTPVGPVPIPCCLVRGIILFLTFYWRLCSVYTGRYMPLLRLLPALRLLTEERGYRPLALHKLVLGCHAGHITDSYRLQGTQVHPLQV